VLRDAEFDARGVVRGATTARADALVRDADGVRAVGRLDDRVLRDTGRDDAEALLPTLCDCCGGLPVTTSGPVPSKNRNAGIRARARNRPLLRSLRAFMAKSPKITIRSTIATLPVCELFFTVNYIHHDLMQVK